jgi:hypothetical protein
MFMSDLGLFLWILNLERGIVHNIVRISLDYVYYQLRIQLAKKFRGAR